MNNTMRVAASLTCATLILLGGAATAHADHVHFRVLGSGECVLLAPEGGEMYVTLPHADEFAENRRHPLHVNVHFGQPGVVGMVHVAYVNGVLTGAALEKCGGEFVNR